MFSYEIREIFKNIYFEEHLQTTASKHRSSFLEVFCRSCCSALMLWWNITFYSFSAEIWQGSKLESVTCKFTKNCTSSQVFFKEFHHRCRTAILKNASWWLLLRTNLFWKHSCTAASQRRRKHIFILEIFTHILRFLLWRHVKEERIFMIFLQ